jgi:hypothetical protein
VTGNYSRVEDVLEAVWNCVEFGLFQQRPGVDSVGIFGSGPLKTVISWGDLSAVELLLGAGADIDARHEAGDTALHHAIRMGKFGIARHLIRAGADQSIVNHEGKRARDLCWDGEWEGLGLSAD